jgi:hypothetical protein
MEARLAAMRERLLKMAEGLRGRPYLTAVPAPPADAPPPPLPFHERAEDHHVDAHEPGEDG